MLREFDEVIAAHDEISLPLNSEGIIDPRVNLTRQRELVANKKALWPLDLQSQGLIPKLANRLPELAEPIEDVVAADVCWSRPGGPNGISYLSLCFDRETTELLGAEQADIWDELPRIAGKDTEKTRDKMKWDPYDPRMLVIAIGAGIQRSPITRIRSHIEKRAPFELTLLPVGEQRQAQEEPLLN